ncbi:alanine/glycine:cation symporter family protein [Brachyspira hyodysenteriae]|uniref:alanine/glycine:cation symporter family protein n=1 Tax=Brachyspira hyodysenteriae TaxID=159 RepID=UPI0022CD87B7|nr:sodium:alanine symporter family protein [Brachyspira hyodysenteriae]MCZ9851565.1 sodium:alanine symporter family protein [Brachyspira hyodysenteriae]MCZ9859695.1 sodium:alanine symporter family protein [Brachyspira hyodysenteriae]MCZ9893615.1 sodium:alanine symporter family protein [Brachyspira hyodysenteriae]MCZ9916144.1 sodium:alanine symporter family protein [Brachyspira hyodysenteriae]MCZ9921483.1 sodium:alanine symporter family protein [Brachyspira hyodysenteriae]
MDTVSSIVAKVNSFLWDYLLIILLCGSGIYFTIRFKFVQIFKFKDGWDRTFGSLSLMGKSAGKEGMSSFQSLATAIAAQVGTGNLAGAATALISGGPGAIFWMWVSAFLGMATIFVEASLGQKYKTTTEDGHIIGGPAYYIQAAYKGWFGKILSVLFAIFIILALGFMGNMVQSNSISGAFVNAFPQIKPIYVGIICALIAAFIFIGGLKRIASFAEKIVPIMALFYIIGSLIIILMNIENLASSIILIFTSAFNPQAVIGGGLGIGVQQAMRFGVARGLFSNEAGMGSTPHAHALAKVNHPCEQGVVAMIGVFFDTFIVVTLTALVILTSNILQTQIYPLTSAADIPEILKGVGLPQEAFRLGFGYFGVIFVAVCLFFFAFTTIIGWYFFGEQNIKYLFGVKVAKVYAVFVVGFVLLGSALKVDLVWSLADTFNGLMVIPNLLGLLALGSVVSVLLKEYNELNKK